MTNRQILKNIIIIAMPMTISAVLGALNKNIDSMTVVRSLKTFLSEEEAQIQYGILSGKVETLVTFPFSFNIAFATALVPAIASAKASKNMESARKRISFSLLVTILIGLPCSVGMIIYAEPILKLLFPNASSGAFIFQISAMSIIFVTIEQTVTGALQGLGKTYVPLLSLLVRSGIKTYNKFNICKNKSRYIYFRWSSRSCFWNFSMPYSFYANQYIYIKKAHKI